MSLVFRQEVGATLRLAVPLAFTQLAQMAMGFVDVIMIGRLGTAALAGGVLGQSLFYTAMIVCLGVVLAVNPSVAQSYGAGAHDDVGRWTRQGLWLATALGAPLLLLFQFAEPFLLFVGQEPESSALAADYLKAARWGVVPNLWFVALRGFCEGLGRPRPILVVMLAAIGVNVLGNWVLMYGKWGFPALGLKGCGWSTAIVMAAMFVGLATYIRVAPALRRYRVFVGLRRPDPSAFRALLHLGWPIGVNFGLEAGLFLIATFLIGQFGAVALAAHQVAINAASVTFMIPLGIGLAATARVGQTVGASDAVGAARAGWIGITLGALSMVIPALVFWLRPEWVVWVYTGQGAGEAVGPDVKTLAATLLGVAAVFQLFDGTQASAAGALRGLKDTRVPMLIGAVSYWGVGLVTASVLAFGVGLGAVGVWWGLTTGLAAAAVLLTLRFGRRSRDEALAEERAGRVAALGAAP